MDVLAYLAIAVIAYLLGSISTGILVSKALGGPDLHKVGSGNTGATNALRTMGKKGGAIVFAGDVVKALLACLGGRLWMGQNGALLAGLFVILGHNWPVFFGFKGGKGVLVAAGAILAVQPVLLPVLALIFLVCLVPTGMVSLGSITMAAAYPVLTLVYSLLRGLPTRDVVVCTVGAAIMGGMVIWMHRSNIQRIRDGKEYRFGQKHKSN